MLPERFVEARTRFEVLSAPSGTMLCLPVEGEEPCGGTEALFSTLTLGAGEMVESLTSYSPIDDSEFDVVRSTLRCISPSERSRSDNKDMLDWRAASLSCSPRTPT